jgi:hypothetical protein
MLVLLSRLVVLLAGALTARAYARDFVLEYVRRLIRERLRSGLLLTASQLALLAATAVAVHRLGDPLGGRLLGSALVWVLVAYNATRFLTNTVPEIAEARRHLRGTPGSVVRGLLGISVATVLVEMELIVLGICLVLALSARLRVSSTFHLLEPWGKLLALRR